MPSSIDEGSEGIEELYYYTLNFKPNLRQDGDLIFVKLGRSLIAVIRLKEVI